MLIIDQTNLFSTKFMLSVYGCTSDYTLVSSIRMDDLIWSPWLDIDIYNSVCACDFRLSQIGKPILIYRHKDNQILIISILWKFSMDLVNVSANSYLIMFY